MSTIPDRIAGPDVDRDEIIRQLEEVGAVPYAQAIADLAAEDPERTALVVVHRDGSETPVTRREFDTTVTRYARVLRDRGVGVGDRVATVLPNGTDIVALGYATWRLGGLFLPVSAAAPARERDAILELFGPKLAVALNADLAVPTIALDELRGKAAAASTEPLENQLAWPGKAIASGGSSGRSKIIIEPRPMVWLTEPYQPIIDALGMEPGMRHLVSGPLYHNWQFDLCFNGLVGGGEVILLERFDARQAVDAIRRHRIEYAGLVPTTMRRIAQLEDLDPSDLDSLRGICHTAAPCPPSLKRTWIELLGPERVYELYGATEALGLTAVRGDDWLSRPGTVGRPVGCELVVLDEDRRPVAPLETGTIFLRRDDPTLHGYYEGADPAPVTDDGFVTVGDLGWLDEDGFLFVADRRTDLIISGGVNVYPAEVEAALAEHPDVAEAVVIGLPDEEWGQRVHAIVELVGGETGEADELREFCRGLLAAAKAPKTIEFVDAIPRTDAGKVRRTLLVEQRAERVN